MTGYAWLLYNPAAGRFPAGWLLSRAVAVLTAAGWEVEVHETTPQTDIGALATEAVTAGCDAVFVAGGDGSVGRVSSALAETGVAMGVLPSGTANVWAREIGLERLDWIHLLALERAAHKLATGTVQKVDMGSANNVRFLLWAGVGLDAEIVSSVEPRERWEKAFGALNYGLRSLWSTLGWEGVDLRVSAGDRSWEGRYLVAIASNVRRYAGGFVELAPDASYDDGLLDFWLIGGKSTRDAVMRTAQVLLGMHTVAPGVIHFQAEHAVFETDGDFTLQFDGEPEQVHSPLEFRTLPRSLNVLVPEPDHQKN